MTVSEKTKADPMIGLRAPPELKSQLENAAANADRSLAAECVRRLRRSFDAKALVEDIIAIRFGFRVDVTDDVVAQVFNDIYAAVSPSLQAAKPCRFQQVAQKALRDSVTTGLAPGFRASWSGGNSS